MSFQYCFAIMMMPRVLDLVGLFSVNRIARVIGGHEGIRLAILQAGSLHSWTYVSDSSFKCGMSDPLASYAYHRLALSQLAK